MNSIQINGITIYGISLDSNTRCKHYHGSNDVIAIRMKCCNRYYACNSCHHEMEAHDIIPWAKEDFGEKAVICGMCGHELTIDEYMHSLFRCPNCQANFNPNCSKHYPIYFGVQND
ncbi:MAG: CHY zinc finger protein [Bacteroidales bacterium]